MSVIVTDAGFARDTLTTPPVPLAEVAANGPLPEAILLAPEDDPAALAGRLAEVALIVVRFPSFADGRGFTHARSLRTLGYPGRLRASGHVIQISMPWPAARALTRWRSAMISPPGSLKNSGWPAPIGNRTTIRDDCVARPEPAPLSLSPLTDYHGRAARAAAMTLMTEQKPVTETSATPVSRAVPTLPDAQTVTSVRHYTDRLFAFRVTRPASLRFRSGEFVMIGLMGDNGKPLLRAYSIASPAWDDELEFYSIKVPDGPLTSKLQHISPGDQIILRPKPVGTLVHDALLPGKRLYFFATGTGFAPFASLLREPQTYEDYDEVIITHTCRDVAELTYGRELIEGLKADELMIELLGEENLAKIKYYPTTTREQSPKMGRITTLIENGTLFSDLGVPPLDPETDRAMVCGSLEFNKDIKALLEAAGLEEGANSEPKQFVIEKAFVG